MIDFNLYKTLMMRELRERYLTSMAGMLWAFLLPLMLLAVYAFVFTKIFHARFPGQDEQGFVPYLAVALWPWIAFSESLQRASQAITANESLIGKVAIPHEILVYSSSSSTFLINLFGFVVVMIVLAISGVQFNWTGLPTAAWALVLVAMLTLAMSLIAAATQVFIRDLSHALPAILMLGFFATPILYPLTAIPAEYLGLLQWNPFAYLIDMLRQSLLGNGYQFGLRDLWASLGFVLVLVFSLFYFKRLASRFEDFL